MLNRLLRFVTREDELIDDDIDQLSTRHKFSKYLPYRVYDRETEAYINIDNSVGYLWECSPLVYAGAQTFTLLESMLNQVYPDFTVLQFILWADPHITPILDQYKSLKTKNSGLNQKAMESLTDYFYEGRKGVDKLAGIPIRNFRLFVAFRLPVSDRVNEYNDLKNNIYECLKGVNLHPEHVPPEKLINVLGKIFSPGLPEMPYDPDEFINNQIITSDTPITEKFDKLLMGDQIWRCQTVKKMATYIDSLTFNYLNGDIMGVSGDNNQINTPFLMTINVIFEDLYGTLQRKCNFVLQQKAVGSLAPTLVSKQREYTEAVGEIERGVRYLRVMPIIFHCAEDEEASKKSSARLRRIWQARGFTPQEDRGILKLLWLAALPFGLYTDKNAVDFLNRDFICQPKVAAKCLPVQVDFLGGGMLPQCLFVGRKGQLINLDLFSKSAANSNCLVAATSGAGKSFLLNYLVYNYNASETLVRIIDIGKSYQKLCNILGGKYISFNRDFHISLNPFSNVFSLEDLDESLNTITAVLAQMIYSSSGSVPSETEYTLIRAAVTSVYNGKGPESSIDDVFAFLASPTRSLDEVTDLIDCGDDSSCIADIKKVSTQLAFNLRSFTSTGQYGRWFQGKSSLNISKEDFVVLELEELTKQPELFKVVVLQVLDYVTADLYLSDRSKKRMIIFDEAWQFFQNDGRSTHTGMMAKVIEEGYRRARKYGGSFTTVVQSLLDFEAFGPIGRVIQSNSGFQFFLESEDFERARSKNIIDYDDFLLFIMKSVKSPRPRYSEFFMKTPIGSGVARLVVDPFFYYISTSDARETAEIERMVKSGLSYEQAIGHMINGTRPK